MEKFDLNLVINNAVNEANSEGITLKYLTDEIEYNIDNIMKLWSEFDIESYSHLYNIYLGVVRKSRDSTTNEIKKTYRIAGLVETVNSPWDFHYYGGFIIHKMKFRGNNLHTREKLSEALDSLESHYNIGTLDKDIFLLEIYSDDEVFLFLPVDVETINKNKEMNQK